MVIQKQDIVILFQLFKAKDTLLTDIHIDTWRVKMGKVYYENMSFDSEWEKDYYIYLIEIGVKKENIWRNIKPFTDLIARNKYTPDFIYFKGNSFCIVEIKGNYNPYANHFQDEMIHKEMKAKTQAELKAYVLENGIKLPDVNPLFFCYFKLKKLKKGWVDYDYKNPNTLANKRKEKINEQKDEIKKLQEFKKNAERYFKYHLKIVKNEKLTKPQKEWYYKYVEELKERYS